MVNGNGEGKEKISLLLKTLHRIVAIIQYKLKPSFHEKLPHFFINRSVIMRMCISLYSTIINNVSYDVFMYLLYVISSAYQGNKTSTASWVIGD